MSTAQIEKPQERRDLRSIIKSDHFKNQLALALPKHITPDRFSRIVLTAITRTPKLLDCTQESVLKCCMDLSAFGLEPDGRRAHLIPYGRECTLVIDYKGFIELAKRNGDVKDWRAELVKENDEFSWENGQVSHRVDWRNPRGAAQCVYSHVLFRDGTSSYEVMTLDEVEEIRKRSRAANAGPWKTDYGEMCKKTVIRRHSKRMTLSAELMDAIAKDDEHNGIQERNVTPARIRPNFDGPALPEPEDSGETLTEEEAGDKTSDEEFLEEQRKQYQAD